MIEMSDYIWRKIKTPNWEPVSFASSCIYEKNLYLSGGWNPLTNALSSQFWKCDSDFNWEKIVNQNHFNPRNGHTMTKYNDRIYIIGGFNYKSRFLEDVWILNPNELSEGWKCILPNAPWDSREGHKTIVFRDSLWIFGGKTLSRALNDIWISRDGINWEEAAPSSPWSRRCFHNVQLYNDKLWLIAGSSTIEIANNDMFCSKNGVDWELHDEPPPFTPRFGGGVTVFDEKMWLIGGSDASEKQFYNDVWWFTEKEGWNQLGIDTPWTPRWGFNCVSVYNDNLVVLCGGVRYPDRKYSAFTDGWILQKK